MKHLVKYKLYEEALPTVLITKERMEEIFKPLINWDLFQDLKDLSVEYLDDYFELYLSVEYYYKWYWSGACNLKFGHKIDENEWYDLDTVMSQNPSEEEFKDLKLRYRFALTKNNSYRRKREKDLPISSYYDSFYRKESEDLLKRIKEFYPDENIMIYEVDNF